MNLIPEALKRINPMSQFVLEGIEYEGLRWLSKDIPQPSKEDVEAMVEVIKQEIEDNAYKDKRKMEYPPLEDFVDALYWERLGEHDEMNTYLEKVAQVKEKYPKPNK